MKQETFQVAIDGPVAAGKSTISQKLAGRLGFLYVDTGAMYRAVTLQALRNGVSLDDEERLVELVDRTDIEMRVPSQAEQDGRTCTVFLDGEDVSWEIRTPRVNQSVAVVASLPKVREALVPKQQDIAGKQNVVMEGRDITYVVLPDADLKIFLDASEEVRAKRYANKLNKPDRQVSLEEATEWLRERDELDRNREASPLKIVPGVWHLDTSDKTIEEVVDEIAGKVREMSNQ